MNEQPNSPQHGEHGENAGPEVPVPPPAVGQQAYYLPVGQAAARYMVWHSTRMSMRMSMIMITQGEACAQG
ncbi:MAG: hypothetical protein ACPHCI_09060, partial [Solirubrobacterales bacterium]